LSRTPSGDLVATPFDQQDSSMMKLLANSDCLIIRAPHAEALDVGSDVDIVLFRDGIDIY